MILIPDKQITVATTIEERLMMPLIDYSSQQGSDYHAARHAELFGNDALIQA